MTKNVWEQTAADMDERFGSGGFSGAGGNMQSLSFMFTALVHIMNESPVAAMLRPLMEWTSKPRTDGDIQVEGTKAVIYDIGCAEGDGTAILSHFFPLSDITGIDISPVAVERAKARWPHLNFQVGDITDPDIEVASLIFTSHTIEHIEDPVAVIRGLLAKCSVLVVIVPPIGRFHKGTAHVGAAAIKDWLPGLPEPLYTKKYNTMRPDLDNGGAIEEGNILLLWKGEA